MEEKKLIHEKIDVYETYSHIDLHKRVMFPIQFYIYIISP